MAIYHCSIKTFSRSKGQSAVASAAYRTGKKLTDERTGLIADYTKRKGVVASEIITPDQCPEWAKDTNQLWNQAEKSENRKNSTVAREFEISLPHELDKEQRLALAKALTSNLVKRFGFVAEFSIHKPDKEESKNHHVHILATTRKINPDGFGEKTRELDEAKSGAVEEVRAMVADTINQHLEKAQINQKVDHRSLLAQQKEAIQQKDYIKAVELSREPTRHIGKNPAFIEENTKHNEQVKRSFSDFLKSTIGKVNQITLPKTKQFSEVKEKKVFLASLGKGLKSLIEGDWFGIEARELEKQKQEEKAQKSRQKQAELEQEKQQAWKMAVEAVNKANEDRLRSSSSFGETTHPPPSLDPSPTPKRKLGP